MLRVLLLSLALCHVVFALPNAFETEDDFEREIEELVRALVKEEDRADNGLEEMDRATGLTPLSIVGMPTEQSTTNGARYPSGNAVDGNRDTNLNKAGSSCTHTKEENNPWWTVDLGGAHCISKVTILNRGDCCSERLTNAIVRVGNRVCGSPVTTEQARVLGGTIVVECDPPLMGDSIQVEIPGTSYLQLCEVTVEELIPHDQCLSMNNELSIVRRPTTQSTTYDPIYRSGNAVDGNPDTNLNKAGSSCTHTRAQTNPWWRVYLGGVHCVTKVVIVNRGDCCNNRLTGAVVRAGTSIKYITDNAICGSPVTAEQASTPGGTIEIICDPPLRASYVYVWIYSSDAILQLCEVTVEEMLPGYC